MNLSFYNFFTLWVSLCLSFAAMGQLPAFEWAGKFGGNSDDYSDAMVVDASGNAYFTGCFRSASVDFDPDTTKEIVNRSGKLDAFVTKLDANGKLKWVAHLAGVGYQAGTSVAVDDSGNVYSCGWYRDSVDFDPGPGTHYMEPVYGEDIYLLKLDSNGQFVWARSLGPGGTIDVATFIKVGKQGGIYVTGLCGQCDYNFGTGDFTHEGAAFILHISANGDYIWVRNFPSSPFAVGFMRISEMDEDSSGSLYIGGTYYGSIDFDPGPGSFYSPQGNPQMAFVCKIDTAGNLVWFASLGGLLGDNGINALKLDGEGNLYFTGYFSHPGDFDAGDGTFTLNGALKTDIFVCKYSNNGRFLWAKEIAGGTGDDIGHALDVDDNGNVYIAGEFRGVVDFNPGMDTFNLVSSGVNSSGFICKLNSLGDFVAAAKIGGNGDDVVTDVKLWYGNVYATGSFQSAVDFDPGISIYNLNTAANTSDMFLMKLGCQTTTGTAFFQACDTFVSPSGKYVWKQSGVYYDVLLGSNGCDSVVTVNLTVVTTDTGVTDAYPVIVANADNAQYQWINCEGLNTVIGETSKYFKPIESGNYAVVIYN